MLQIGYYTTNDGREACVLSHVGGRFTGRVVGEGHTVTWEANGKRKRIRSVDNLYGWGSNLDLKLSTFRGGHNNEISVYS